MRDPMGSGAWSTLRTSAPLRWVATFAAPVAAHALASLATLSGFLGDAVVVLFTLAIALVAASGSWLHALAAAVTGFALYRWHETPDRLAAWLTPNEFVVLSGFLACAWLVAWIASGPRREVASLTLRQAHGALRRDLAESLAEQNTVTGVVRAALGFLESRVCLEAVLWLGGRAHRAVHDGQPPPRPPADLDSHCEHEGWLWCAIDALDKRLGAVGMRPRQRPMPGDLELAHLLCGDIAHWVARARLTEELQRERVANESERLCTALLASVSHDLRTPLTTIMGAAESLRTLGESLSDGDRGELLGTIEAEGKRLDRYIQNLVDVTRIGDGEIVIESEPSTVDELIASAAARLRRYVSGARLEVDIEPGVPPVRVHAPLVEQAIFNVLHNASKFSPDGAPIQVRAAYDGNGQVGIEIVDRGPGIPRAERERVFDMFYSADRGDPARAGTGLGLAISQSIVRAHGGEVSAHAGRDGVGTRMRLAVPVAPPAEQACG